MIYMASRAVRKKSELCVNRNWCWWYQMMNEAIKGIHLLVNYWLENKYNIPWQFQSERNVVILSCAHMAIFSRFSRSRYWEDNVPCKPCIMGRTRSTRDATRQTGLGPGFLEVLTRSRAALRAPAAFRPPRLHSASSAFRGLGLIKRRPQWGRSIAASQSKHKRVASIG